MFGLFVQKQAFALGHKTKVGVVALMPDDTKQKIVIEKENYKNVLPEIRVFVPVSGYGFVNVLRTYRAYKMGVKEYIREFGKPDLIHANIFTRTAVSACLFARKMNIPFVVSEHWSRYFSENFSYKGFLRRFFTKYVAKKAKAVLVPSIQLKNAMIEAGIHADYKLVPNVIDCDLFALPEVRFQSEKKRIVHISCFEDKSKNISGLIDAIQILSRKRNDFELHLVGTGIDLRIIKEKVAIKELEDFVVFHGMLENEELAGLLKTATCSVLSSHYETFAIVVYESLSCGVPVVVTDVAGLGKLVSKELGLVVSTGDMHALAGALDKMLDSSNVYQPETLRKFILNDYSGEAVAEKLMEIYNMSGEMN